jgi:hypothetical protein
MSGTPVARVDGLRIGVVDFISPDEVKVLLDIEAPDTVALNAGGVRPFPRVNGYILLPVDDGYLVGQIEWITVERSAFPKRRGMQDFGLIDLPYPLRRMSLNPLGTLRKRSGPHERYMFGRGAESLPSIGTPALLPTEIQLRAIVESGERRRIRIGKSPLAGDAEVRVDPDRLFGRHIAVLGNTGSGKSCSVAGLIRWSLEAAREHHPEKGPPNARFIILDPNGEYATAFPQDDPSVKSRIYRVGGGDQGGRLQVPLWLWNSNEWASFTQASARTQRPLLKRALREVKAGRSPSTEATVDDLKLALRRYLSSVLITIRRDLRTGAIRTDESKFGFFLGAVQSDLETSKTRLPGIGLEEIVSAIQVATTATFNSFTDKATGTLVKYYRAFTEAQINGIVSTLESALASLGGLIYQSGPDEDVPIRFAGTDLADHLEYLAGDTNQSQFLDFLVARIRTFLSDPKIRSVVGEDEDLTLQRWLEQYVGGAVEDECPVTVLDLSLVPAEVIHVVTAVAARVAFEALQRYRRAHGEVLPTVLVMVEAHTFVKRYRDEAENQDAAAVCCQVFERIAREGRKFGLGLVLSSQRPSELSATVLSQCNTFLLHRISNDRDQELVHRLVPDNLRGLLRELPSLPSQNAVLLGWASELPVLVRMDDLPKSQRPKSDDPDFWYVWTTIDSDGQRVRRPADWKPIAEEWQQTAVPPTDGEAAAPPDVGTEPEAS